MRIIAGKYKSRRFEAKIPNGTRPTSDMARESVFDILYSYMDFENINVIDIFAGTGAMGFEALSRGAGYCLFVDKSIQSTNYIRNFAEKIGLEDVSFDTEKDDVVRSLRRMSRDSTEPFFELAFLDPPYQSEILNTSLSLLAEGFILKPEGIAVVEHSVRMGINIPNKFDILTQRTFGDTIIEIIKTK